MNSWNRRPRAAFDVETTGRDPRTARLVTASIVVVDGEGKVVRSHEWLADPGIDIPAETTALHGVTTAHARAYGEPAATVIRGVSEVLGALFAAGTPVMAYNAAYDFTVLAHEARRHGVDPLGVAPVIDPYICNKQVDRYRRGKRTLTDLCREYGVVLEAAHTSAADALATVRLADALALRFGALLIDAADLHDAQVGWAREQAADFQAYLRRVKDPAAVIEGVWPVLP